MSDQAPTKQATPTAAPHAAKGAPGQHRGPRPGGPGGSGGHPQRGRRRRNISRFGTQMQEKQSLKAIYGIREEQLKRYYRDARAMSNQTGQALISLLERRLDNALYRAGFATTRPQARQIATHRLVSVNGRPVDVPSLRLKTGDTVTVRDSKRAKDIFTNFEKRLQNVNPPSWITLQPQEFSFKVTALPTDADAAAGINIQAIVEYFAR